MSGRQLLVTKVAEMVGLVATDWFATFFTKVCGYVY